MMNFDSKPLRWGICGAGRISNDFCTALASLPKEQHQVTSVAARNEFRATEFATRFDIPNSFDNYEALIDSEDVDVIYVGVVNPAHKQIILTALHAKKPVLSEKPICTTSSDVKEIIAAVKETGVFCMEGYWSRFFPASEKIAELVEADKIGTVKMLSAAFCRVMEDNVMTMENGGGCTLTIGYYMIALACMLFGKEKPKSIQANAVIDETGVDRSTNVRLEYHDGGVAQLYCTTGFEGSCEAGIEGTKGAIKINYPMWCPTDLTLPGAVELKHPPESEWTDKGTCNYINSWGFRYEAEHVRQCLIKGLTGSPIWTLEHALSVAEMSATILRQIGYGKPHGK